MLKFFSNYPEITNFLSSTRIYRVFKKKLSTSARRKIVNYIVRSIISRLFYFTLPPNADVVDSQHFMAAKHASKFDTTLYIAIWPTNLFKKVVIHEYDSEIVSNTNTSQLINEKTHTGTSPCHRFHVTRHVVVCKTNCDKLN